MKIDRDAPIGVFDSGVGGLTVAREIMRNLPSEKIVYFGDTARVPYGSKSKETIIRYSRQIIHFLREQQVKAIVIACNTASAFALDAVKDELDIPCLLYTSGVECHRNECTSCLGSNLEASIMERKKIQIISIFVTCSLREDADGNSGFYFVYGSKDSL